MAATHEESSRDERDFEQANGRPMNSLERRLFKAMQTIPHHRRGFPDQVLPVIMPIINGEIAEIDRIHAEVGR